METGYEKLRLGNIQVFAVYGYIAVEMSRSALLSKEDLSTPTYPSAGLFILVIDIYIFIFILFISVHNPNTVILNLMAFCRRIVLSRAYVFYCLLQARFFRH